MSMINEEKTQAERLTSRVFIVEEVRNVPIESAEEFGTIVPLFESAVIYDKKLYSTRPSIWEEDEDGKPTLIDEILDKLEKYNYDPEKDYILIAGHMIPVVILVAAVVGFGEYEQVKVLFWSPDWKQYVVRTI